MSMVQAARNATAEEVERRLPHVNASEIKIAFVLDGEPGAVALQAEPFDSELFGLRIGRITAVDALTGPAYDALLSPLLERARNDGYDQILRRTGIERLEEIWALGRHGFELMDVGVVFGCSLPSVIEARPYQDLVVRQATASDVEVIVQHMLQLPWGSRYEADPAYGDDRVRELRARWLWNSYHGRAAAFLVGVIDEEPGGYVTCLVDAHEKRGEIELVGTLPSHRGRRVASRVLESALAWFSERVSFVTVRTQATNYAAAALYEKTGFTLHASDLTFRRNSGAV